MSLGSIYAPQQGDKGRDLRWKVELPAAAVGGPGLSVKIPDRLPVKDAPERAARTIHAQDPKGAVLLHLPQGFASGSALRLRGYGEAKPGAGSGDLFLVVHLAERGSTALVHQVTALAKTEGPAWGWALLGALLAALGAFFVL